MSGPVIVAARRTIVAPRGGALAELEIHELAAPVLRACLDDAGLAPDEVDEVILSNALGAGGNPARLAALAAGLPERVAGLSIDRQCVGGLDAVLLAHALVASGQARAVLAGGAESYSRRPIRMRVPGHGPPDVYDRPPFVPWPERDPDMAEAADTLARDLGLSRAGQEQWAIDSHAKTLAAADETAPEIVPLNGTVRDTFPRKLSQRLCARAPVVAGSVTTATMAVAADAAAFVLVVSPDIARRLARPWLAIGPGVTLGDAPQRPGLAPVAAIRATLARSGLPPDRLASAEIMEAFAAQAIACQCEAGLPRAIVNRQGGALARGHPIGASGAILAVRLYHQLAGTSEAGLAAIAAAGGLGTTILFRGRP
ncbi:MAG TPA: acetyl-CoA C-acyltransferase [Rhodobacteraceae bacterium]|nr:acetyl-CoA C-acyltransferase [Paracoccaceae bacterium]